MSFHSFHHYDHHPPRRRGTTNKTNTGTVVVTHILAACWGSAGRRFPCKLRRRWSRRATPAERKQTKIDENNNNNNNTNKSTRMNTQSHRHTHITHGTHLTNTKTKTSSWREKDPLSNQENKKNDAIVIWYDTMCYIYIYILYWPKDKQHNKWRRKTHFISFCFVLLYFILCRLTFIFFVFVTFFLGESSPTPPPPPSPEALLLLLPLPTPTPKGPSTAVDGAGGAAFPLCSTCLRTGRKRSGSNVSYDGMVGNVLGWWGIGVGERGGPREQKGGINNSPFWQTRELD